MFGWRCVGSSAGSGKKHKLRFGARHLDGQLCQLPDRKLARIAKIDGTRDAGRAVHQFDKAFDQIVHIAERARLRCRRHKW